MNKITCIDGVQGMRRLPPSSIPLVVTSPPWEGLREFDGHVFDQEKLEEFVCGLWRVLMPGGVICWDTQDQVRDGAESGESFRQVLLFLSLGFTFHQTVIVDTRSAHRRRPDNGMMPPHYVFVFSKGKPRSITKIFDEKNKLAGQIRRHSMIGTDGVLRRSEPKEIREYGPRGPVWHFHGGGFNTTRDEEAKPHPGKMIELLVRDLIKVWSKPGDVVLDPFAGAGTTCKMAMLAGREYVGFEIAAKYVGIARQRLAKFSPPKLQAS